MKKVLNRIKVQNWLAKQENKRLIEIKKGNGFDRLGEAGEKFDVKGMQFDFAYIKSGFMYRHKMWYLYLEKMGEEIKDPNTIKRIVLQNEEEAMQILEECL